MLWLNLQPKHIAAWCPNTGSRLRQWRRNVACRIQKQIGCVVQPTLPHKTTKYLVLCALEGCERVFNGNCDIKISVNYIVYVGLYLLYKNILFASECVISIYWNIFPINCIITSLSLLPSSPKTVLFNFYMKTYFTKEILFEKSSTWIKLSLLLLKANVRDLNNYMYIIKKFVYQKIMNIYLYLTLFLLCFTIILQSVS